MALAFIKSILCCYKSDNGNDELEDETSRLIEPENVEPTYSNVVFVDQQQLQQRLGLIVRAKEGKMVNVGSQIPFNLHNQVLPPDSRYATSRSTSISYEFASTPEPADSQQAYHPYPQSSFARAQSSDSLTGFPYDAFSQARSQSPAVGNGAALRPNPILNVRLVGFTETSQRGRTRERHSQPSGLSNQLQPEEPVSEDDVPTPRPNNVTFEITSDGRQVSKDALKLKDFGAIALSWGD